MTVTQQSKVTASQRKALRRILRRRPAAMADIARSLGVNRSLISHWLTGRAVSARVEAAVLAKCQEIQAEESASAAPAA